MLVPFDAGFAQEQSAKHEPTAAELGEFEDGADRVHGYMLTWHGRWGCRRPEVVALAILCSRLPVDDQVSWVIFLLLMQAPGHRIFIL